MMQSSGDIPSGNSGNVEEQMIPEKSEGADLAAKKRARRAQRKAEGNERRRVRKKKRDTPADALIKYGALFLLVAQMVGLVLLMRMSRTSHVEGQPMYLASTAVFIMEVMKLGICCCVIAYQTNGSLFSELKTHVLESPLEMAKLSVPSFMYTIQNNLLYFALSNLDAATYQVCYQLKILTTAVFSMVLLQVSLSFCRKQRRKCNHNVSHAFCHIHYFSQHRHLLAITNHISEKIFRKEMDCIDSFDDWRLHC